MELNRFIIYTDVDGTAATNYNHIPHVSNANLEAIKEFIKEGGLFGVASGRNRKSIDELFIGCDINMPYIVSNGAQVYDGKTEKVVSVNYIDKEVKKEVYEYVKKNKNLLISAMGSQTCRIYFNDERDYVVFDFERPFITYEEFMEGNFLKCAIISEKEHIDAISEDMNKFSFLDRISVTRTATIYWEFFSLESNKGEGIKHAINCREEAKDKIVVCVGDFYNDIPMLEVADIAICPSNAVEEVKEICDYVASSNENDTLVDVINYLRRLT